MCSYPTWPFLDCELNYVNHDDVNGSFLDVFVEYPEIPDLRIEVGHFGDDVGTRRVTCTSV